jgi:hypothetical protein
VTEPTAAVSPAPLDEYEGWWTLQYLWCRGECAIEVSLGGFVSLTDAEAFAALQVNLVEVGGRGFYLLSQLGHRLRIPAERLHLDGRSPCLEVDEVCFYTLAAVAPKQASMPAQAALDDRYVREALRWWAENPHRDHTLEEARQGLLKHFKRARHEAGHTSAPLDVFEKRGRRVDSLLDELIAKEWFDHVHCTDWPSRRVLKPTLRMLSDLPAVLLADRLEAFRKWRRACFHGSAPRPHVQRDDNRLMLKFLHGAPPVSEPAVFQPDRLSTAAGHWVARHIETQTGVRIEQDAAAVLHVAPTLYVPWADMDDIPDLELGVHSPQLDTVNPRELCLRRPNLCRHDVVAGTQKHFIGWYVRIPDSVDALTINLVWRSRSMGFAVHHQIDITLVPSYPGARLFSTITDSAPRLGMRSQEPRSFVESPFPSRKAADVVLSRRWCAQIYHYQLRRSSSGEQITEIQEKVFLVGQSTAEASWAFDLRSKHGLGLQGEPRQLPAGLLESVLKGMRVTARKAGA